MRYFTSDLHFDDDRLNLFGRDILFKTKEEVDNHIIENWNKLVTKDDYVIVIGDVALSKAGLDKMKLCNGRKILIKGNYDEATTAKFDVSDALLEQYFEYVASDGFIGVKGESCYMNHYPVNGRPDFFNIVGHIHGLWKVQRNMINVGTDANHFTPVSEDQIAFSINGIKKFYDQNVFAGELECNMTYKPSLKLEKTDINTKPNVIIPGTAGDPNLYTIFLAGPIQDAPDWQSKAIDWLNANRGDKTFQIASPRRNYEAGEFKYDVQVNWETKHLNMANKKGVILFWLAKQENFNPTRAYAQTTRFELAEWLSKGNNETLTVGIEPEFSGERYIRMRAKKLEISNTLEDTLEAAIKKLQ